MSFRIIERTGRDRLGEGPSWDSRRGEVLWVDILGQAVHRLDPESGRIACCAVDQPIGWVLPVAGSDRHIAGLRGGFALLDIRDGSYAMIGSPESDRPDNRLNDAKVDPYGRIWAGSKDDTDRQKSGALYRLDADLRWQRMDDGYGVTNGPTFSADGRILYHTDSAARTIYAFDLTADGMLANKRAWLNFPEGWGYPDGMTTDAEGCLWVAHWGGGRLTRFAPDGTVLRVIHLPATNITSCCFAGAGLDRLFVTTSTIGCEDETHAGALFEIDAGVTGLMPTRFAMTRP